MSKLSPALWAVLSAILLGFIGATGDLLIKIASTHPRPFREWTFTAGCGLYALTAVGWVYVMRRLNLAAIGAIFSVTTTAVLAVIGVLVFRETLRTRDTVGIALAVAAILLLSRGE